MAGEIISESVGGIIPERRAASPGIGTLHKGIVQVAGTASVILPDVLRKLADEFEPLRGMLIRHEQVLFRAGPAVGVTTNAC
jgi:hypothetical protein